MFLFYSWVFDLLILVFVNCVNLGFQLGRFVLDWFLRVLGSQNFGGFCFLNSVSWFLTESWKNSCSFFVESCFLFLVSLSLVLESFSCFLLLSWSLVHKKKKKKKEATYCWELRERICVKKKRQYLWGSLERKAKSCVKHECWVKHVREWDCEVHIFCLTVFAGLCFTPKLVETTATIRTSIWSFQLSMDGAAIGSTLSGRIR